MSSFLDRAGSNRTACTVCSQSIAKSAPRVVHATPVIRGGNEYSQRTYYHLACAVELQRGLALEALVARETTAPIVEELIAEVSRLDASLATEVLALRDRPVPAVHGAKPLDDPRTDELLAELEVAPGDRGILAVLGDHLQSIGDERGELIVLDLAASTEPDALARRRELTAMLAPKFRGTAKIGWGVGFIRRLELADVGGLANHAEALAHPSCRLVEVVEINRVFRGTVILELRFLPRNVRTIYVRGTLADPVDLGRFAHLRSLDLDDAKNLASPTLHALAITRPSRVETIGTLDARRLPALRRLRIDGCYVPIMEPLAATDLLPRLEELALEQVNFDTDSVGELERALAGHRLARLSILRQSGALSSRDHDRLAALCTTLELPGVTREIAGPYVEHTGKPEWGRGTIVREFDGKLEIEFASGKRTFKADAPFLKRSR